MTVEHVSTCGKYRPGHNQVALTSFGIVDVSTIWWKRTEPGGDWFETLIFRGQALWPTPDTYASEAAAVEGHEVACHLVSLGVHDAPVTDAPERIGLEVLTRKATDGRPELWETVWSVSVTSGGRWNARTHNHTYPGRRLSELRIA